MATAANLLANWNYPSAIRFGAGRLRELPEACGELGIGSALLVTDRGLADSDMVRQARDYCLERNMRCTVYSDVQGNPVAANITGGVAAYRESGHDGVIALGGGSGLDAAKAIALMVGQSRPIWDFEDREDWWKRVNEAGMAPVVAVPTTSGTGSEVGRASVITDQQTQSKKIIFHPRMLPARVILDPELTLSLPPALSAAVGMDALSHSLEAYCSPLYHPMAAGIALEAMRLVQAWLPRVFKDGNDLEARAHMQVASTMGATAFQKGLGAMHSLSHPCGAVLNTHHGLTNAVVMPYVLAFNRPSIDAKMHDLGRYLGFARPSFPAVQDWVLALRAQLGIPHTLAEIGVKEAHIEKLAPMASADPSSATNPVPVTPQKMAALYADAISGKL